MLLKIRFVLKNLCLFYFWNTVHGYVCILLHILLVLLLGYLFIIIIIIII